jgi:hypothetical protein
MPRAQLPIAVHLGAVTAVAGTAVGEAVAVVGTAAGLGLVAAVEVIRGAHASPITGTCFTPSLFPMHT